MTNRRKMLAGTAAAAATGVAAASSLPKPAIAQSAPELKWRLTSSFPKSLDTIYGAAEVFAKAVSDMTDGKWQIQVFAAGEIVPGLQAADAVTNGTVECCHTASYYYVGKDPSFAFGTAIPFGLNSRLQDAWLFEGGGQDLLNAFYAKYNIYSLPCGNTGCQMGGWFRKEIKTVADMQGLKMRIGGFGGKVLTKLGVVPQQIAGGDIYPALEKGTIDAAEWVGPYDDEKLGLARVSQYYYSPGWWEGGSAQVSAVANKKAWDALPKDYQTAYEAAAFEANMRQLALYDAKNPDAIKRILASGVKLRWFPKDVLDAAYDMTQTMLEEISAKDAFFKSIYQHYRGFLEKQSSWYRVADHFLDNYSLARRAR